MSQCEYLNIQIISGHKYIWIFVHVKNLRLSHYVQEAKGNVPMTKKGLLKE